MLAQPVPSKESLADADGILAEALRRRTFAIISHPDAGKTTLTEKLLLHAGAVAEAGSVRARRQARSTVSDWMEIERRRGISIASTVLRFGWNGWLFNLVDAPGHADFSEDTYRTLWAVDAALMVVDGTRGLEQQTLKLFEVCRRRHLPIVTFINTLPLSRCDGRRSRTYMSRFGGSACAGQGLGAALRA